MDKLIVVFEFIMKEDLCVKTVIKSCTNLHDGYIIYNTTYNGNEVDVVSYSYDTKSSYLYFTTYNSKTNKIKIDIVIRNKEKINYNETIEKLTNILSEMAKENKIYLIC